MKTEKCKCCGSEIIRANGKTTRAVDRIIQEFFENGSARIEEEYAGFIQNERSIRHLEERVTNRLKNEHKYEKYIVRTDVYDCSRIITRC